MTEYIYATDGWGRWTGEEIVRCRDCKYACHFWNNGDERWQCAYVMIDGLDVFPSFFCAWGERRNK